jgi:hypothetical protein
MLAWLVQPILNFMGGPVIKGLTDAYQAKLAAGNTQERIAADLAGRELEVQAKEAEAQTQLRIAMIGRWYEPTQLLGYIAVVYVAKVVIWDIVLGLGTTDPIRGAVGEWMGAIIMFLIGKRGFENVARIIRR